MLDEGMDVEAIDDSGETALLLACQLGSMNYDMINLLIGNGANLYAVDRYNSNALHLCI